MLLRWRHVVEGLFEIERREGKAVVAVNLFDDLTYRIRSNTGKAIEGFLPDCFRHVLRLYRRWYDEESAG